MKLEIGNVVRLKSNGPKMTVHKITATGVVWCQWFTEENLQQGQFSPESLYIVNIEYNSQ